MTPDECILIIPASGFSRRFGEEDKLCVSFKGRPLADYAAQTAASIGFKKMIAVVPLAHAARADIFKARGFDIVQNDSAERGQAYSISLGAQCVSSPYKALCVMLADMPFVTAAHILELLAAAPKDGTIKTQYEDHFQPPAVFTGNAIQSWTQLEKGDGLISHTAIATQEKSLRLAPPHGADVDTREDLERLLALAPDLIL